MTDNDKDINLGKINFNNIKQLDIYNVSFRIFTNLKINPFSDLRLDKDSLEVGTDNN